MAYFEMLVVESLDEGCSAKSNFVLSMNKPISCTVEHQAMIIISISKHRISITNRNLSKGDEISVMQVVINSDALPHIASVTFPLKGEREG